MYDMLTWYKYFFLLFLASKVKPYFYHVSISYIILGGIYIISIFYKWIIIIVYESE